MGGDNGSDVVIPAAIKALELHSNLKLILVGQTNILEKKLKKHHAKTGDRLAIQHASEVVGMDESPSQSVRYKKDSSMRVAINLVKAGAAQACVSAGNTGALLVTSHFVLKTLPGVDRSAIIGMIPAPNKQSFVRMLDLGANVDSTSEQLYQFAVMGAVLTAEVDGVENPRVALLNIGEEEMKGNERVKDAAKLLQESTVVNYVGFAEGDDIFKNKVDVIVCDGFVGNIALKSSEGLASYIRDVIHETFMSSWWTKTLAAFAWPVLRLLRKRLNPALYNGASLVGLRGSVIKSHGGTTVNGFVKAIERAMREAEHKVPERISSQLEELLS